MSAPAAATGRVLWASQGGYHVELDGETAFCRVRGRLLRAYLKSTTPVAVGDEVLVEPAGDGTFLIVERLPRRSTLSRANVGDREVEQVIAANVDQLIVVVSIVDPPLREGLVDRYLVAAHKGHLASLLCVNKIDLVGRAAARQRIALYERLGYPVVLTSATRRQGLGELKAALRGKTSVLSGPSGAGKSSLLNAIDPDLDLDIAEVNPKTGKGVHCTTSARIYSLSFGAWVVDTPGIRELGVWNLEAEEIERCFVEIQGRAAHCQFRSCRHLRELGCAVRDAVERGEIARSRYESYRRLLSEALGR